MKRRIYLAMLAFVLLALVPCTGFADSSSFGLSINKTPAQIRNEYNSYIKQAIGSAMAIGAFSHETPNIEGKVRDVYIGYNASGAEGLFVFANKANKTIMLSLTMPAPKAELDFQIIARCYMDIINILNHGISPSVATDKVNAMLNTFDQSAPAQQFVRIGSIQYDIVNDDSSASLSAKRVQ